MDSRVRTLLSGGQLGNVPIQSHSLARQPPGRGAGAGAILENDPAARDIPLATLAALDAAPFVNGQVVHYP
jgi:hypothetical protein